MPIEAGRAARSASAARAGHSVTVGPDFGLVTSLVGREASIRISGELDLATVPWVAATLDGVAQVRADRVTLDLSELTFIGAAASRVVQSLADRLARARVEFRIRPGSRLSPHVWDALGLAPFVRETPDAIVNTLSVEVTGGARRELVDAALRSVAVTLSQFGAVDGASFTIDRQGNFMTAAATDPTAQRIDDAQYGAGHGPCLFAIRQARAVVIDDVPTDSRWPEFASVATREGVQSMYSTPLTSRAPTLGALNVYARAPRVFDRALSERLDRVATVAGELVAGADGPATTTEDVRDALRSREIVAQAQGVLMARHQYDATKSFAELGRDARASGRSLADQAAEVVATCAGRSAHIEGEDPDAGEGDE